MTPRRQNYMIVDPRFSNVPEVGRWIWALEDARQRTFEGIEGITQDIVDWLPPNDASTIGSLLYHIALIEMDWLYAEVLEQDYPPEIIALFPYPDRDAHGKLTQVPSIPLTEHLARLANVRERLMAVYATMDAAEFRRIRSLPSYDVTPEWVLHHLLQHEAEHRSQIGGLRQAAERALR